MEKYPPEISQYVKKHVDEWIANNCIESTQEHLNDQVGFLREAFGTKKIIPGGFWPVSSMSVNEAEEVLKFWSEDLGKKRFDQMSVEHREFTSPEMQSKFTLSYLSKIIQIVPDDYPARLLFVAHIPEILNVRLRPSSFLGIPMSDSFEFTPNVSREHYDGLAEILLGMYSSVEVKRLLDQNQIDSDQLLLFCYSEPRSAGAALDFYSKNPVVWNNWWEQDAKNATCLVNLLDKFPSLQQRIEYRDEVEGEYNHLRLDCFDHEGLKKITGKKIARLCEDILEKRIEASDIPAEQRNDPKWKPLIDYIMEMRSSPSARLAAVPLAEAISSGVLNQDENFYYGFLVSRDPLMEDVVYGLPNNKSRKDYLRVIREFSEESDYRELAHSWREELKQETFNAEDKRKMLMERKFERTFSEVKKAVKLLE